MSEATVLTLPGVEAGVWQVRDKGDMAAVVLADRHYSRERRGTNQIGGPGHTLVLVTPCERAVWVSKRHAASMKASPRLSDGLDAYRCTLFRNERAGLSSELIRAAMELTEQLWEPWPAADGWVTWVDRRVVSNNPGYCFKKAGWWLDREWSHRRLVRLRADLVSWKVER